MDVKNHKNHAIYLGTICNSQIVIAQEVVLIFLINLISFLSFLRIPIRNVIKKTLKTAEKVVFPFV